MIRLGLAVCLALGAAGCSGGGGGPVALAPVSAPVVTASPSASASAAPTSTATPRPPDDATPESAQEFARYWIETINAAYFSLDSSELRRISDPTCSTCQNYIGSLDRAMATKERFEGGQFTVLQVVSAAVIEGATTVLLNYDCPEFRAFSSDGRLTDTVVPKMNVTLQFQLQLVAGAWVAIEVLRT